MGQSSNRGNVPHRPHRREFPAWSDGYGTRLIRQLAKKHVSFALLRIGHTAAVPEIQAVKGSQKGASRV